MEQTIQQRINDIRHGNIPNGYRKTKLGIIPADWQEVCFGNILHNEVRKVAKPQTAYWRLGIRSHAKGTFREFVEDPTTVNMDELYSVQTNDLVVNITFAWEHAIAIVKEEDSGLLVSHRFPTYVFNENASADFYRYIITLKWVKEQLDLISPGGAGRNRVMNKNAFLKMPCYTLPLEEQRRIAEILGCCDRVISLKKELIAEKKKQKKALMQKLLNPDSGFRLPGFFGEWKEFDLNELGETYSGLAGKTAKDFECGNSFFVPYLNIFENTIVDVNKLEQVDIKPHENQNLVRYGDIFFTTSSETPEEVGMSSVFLADVNNTYLNSFCFGFRLYDFEKLLPFFAAYYLRSDYMRIILNNLAQGATRFNISKTLLMKSKIKIPSSTVEQQAIADILSVADKEIDLLEQELAQQEQKKKSLMQLLLTGIVRV